MEIVHPREFFEVADIIENQYVVYITGDFPLNILNEEIVKAAIPIFIQTWY